MTQATPNAIGIDDLKTLAKTLAAEEANGQEAQIKFALKIVEASFQGGIDMTADKHGPGLDDAAVLAEEYVNTRNGKAIFSAKAAKGKVLIAKFRAVTKLGSWSKGGPGEPLTSVNNLMTIRQGLRKDPANAGKLDDAFNTLLKYARMQVKLDNLLGDHELRQLCFKPVANLKTVEEFYEAMRKTATQLKAGKAANNTAIDNSPKLDTIINACTERLKEFVSARTPVKNVSAQAPKV